MARPTGQFAKQRDLCYLLIKQLAGLGYCFATSRYLSRRLRVGVCQVQRYLDDLKKAGKIEVRTTPAKRDPKTGKLFRKRFIRATDVPNDYGTHRPIKFILGPCVEVDEEVPEYVSTTDQQAAWALDQIKKQREEKAALIALSDSLNPDKQYDEAEILRELQAELEAEGITWSITNGNVSP